ncbi:hypothetical protein [Fibrella forsythiae]|uniref:Uncharacterized protein n=1 Tax=Fibrella forsythiae TaxID=2817061 RepID=A0ABS3JAF9_9BACT|nr:hypothetical protein [Fibrella forsythiae]MBO0946980.1 hypothetical protein [Fibrella forsythiae]
MPKVITYSAIKAQIKPWHQLVIGGDFFTLESFRKHCLTSHTWEYAPGAVKFYDVRDKTFHEIEPVDDPTPERTPEPVVVETVPVDKTNQNLDPDPDLAESEPAAEPPMPDYSIPPPGWVPGPMLDAIKPAEEPVSPIPPVDKPAPLVDETEPSVDEANNSTSSE